eukprot:Hpha_TRINITY_DN16825_c2_g9::TRINITY_DN16825_c2_g9_i1::g.148941::m.148941
MGKVKKGLKSTGGQPGAAGAPVQRPIVPAVQKLMKPDSKIRLQGCIDCAALSLDDQAVQTLARSAAGTALLACLVDPEPLIRIAASQALRNLVLCGGEVACQQLLSASAPQRLRGIFAETWAELCRLRAAGVQASSPFDEMATDAPSPSPDITPSDDLIEMGDGLVEQMQVEIEGAEKIKREGKSQPILMYNLAGFVTELIQLLSALSHASQNATHVFGDADAVNALVACILFPPVKNASQSQPSVVAGDCLQTLADDNEEVLGCLRAMPPNIQQELLGLLRTPPISPEGLLVRVSVAGVLWQVDRALLPECIAALAQPIADTPSVQAAMAELSVSPSHPREGQDLEEFKKARREQIRQVEMRLTAALSAAESLSNVVSGADGPAPEDADDEEAFKVSDVGTVMLGQGAAAVHAVVAKTCELLTVPPPKEMSEQPLLANIGQAYDTLRGTTSTCLMNLLIVLPPPACGDPGAVWTASGKALEFETQRLSQPHGSSDAGLRTLASSAHTLWTLVRKGACPPAAVAGGLPSFGAAASALRGKTSVPAEDALTNVLGLLGAVGQQLSDDRGPQRAAAVSIAEVLVGCLHESSITVNLEAMNAVIDVFADDQWDDLFRERGVVPELAKFANVLGTKVSTLQRSGGGIPESALPRLELVQDNLGPFIEYKASRLR